MASRHQARGSDTSSADVEVAPLGNEHLVALQRDDLGTARRDHISTDDHPDNHYGNVTTQDLERHRLVNRQRTHSTQEIQRVAGWNNAWQRLTNDELIEEGLHDLNAGQTHRARLLAEVKSHQRNPNPAATLATASRGLGNRSRGTGPGGRGGTRVTLGLNRSARSRIAPSTTPELLSRIRLPSSSKQFPTSTAGRTSITDRLSSAHAAHSTSSSPHIRYPRIQSSLAGSYRFMSHALASILEASAATASGREEASNRTHKDSATTIPAHLRQDAPADELRQTTGVATVDAASETQEAAHRQPRSSTHISEAISYDRPKPVMGTLIEEQPLPTMDYPKSPSNMEDLLGLQFEKTNLYVVPVQSSVNTNSTVNPLAAAVTQPMAQNLTSTSTSYLSILKNSNYSPAFLTGIQSILAQRNETSGESVARQDTHATRGSLAEAVQRNTIQWQQQVIQGTVPSTPSILGDSVVRNRFHRWYDSADSVNSMASEESALTHLPGLHRSRSGTQSTRANRSGSGLTSMGPSRSVASTDVSPPRRPTALSTSAPRGPRPQLPAFLESAPHYDDPAAAARAQYSGRTAALQASPTARIVPTPPNLPGAARTRTRTQGTLDENASVSSGDAASGRSLVMGSRNEIVPSQHASSSMNDALPRFPTAGNRAASSTGPNLPAFLALAQPPKDPGAAAREQYGRRR